MQPLPLPPRPSSPVQPEASIIDSGILATQALLLPPADHTTDSVASSSLVSVPASPMLGYASDIASSVRAAYMSESELSAGGSERHSIMRTISNIWTWRGAEFLPLDYPLCVLARSN